VANACDKCKEIVGQVFRDRKYSKEDETMSRMKSLTLLLALVAQVSLVSATTTTYTVGWCQPNNTSFDTITEALAATPAPNVVQVCPGTYNEQLVITKPVTLEGITVGDAAQVIVAAPSGGLVTNATSDLGDPIAAQVWVESANGAVTLSNLTVDGTGNNVASGTYIVGVFFQDSPGTVNRLTIQNQNGNSGGVGLWLEGGSANPTVTVENTNLQAFDYTGMAAETNSNTSELTATIKGNYLASSFASANGIDLLGGQTATTTGNLITVGSEGVVIEGGSGAVSSNKVLSGAVGIALVTDGVSVTNNMVYNNAAQNSFGIIATSATAAVTGNTIAQFSAGISLQCAASANVHSNTILDAAQGLINVPAGAAPSNTYYNVGTISSGGC
jgi:hypothetical protein